jgi:hypothetical protein
MWRKLLQSSAVEAVGHLHKENRFQPPTPATINTFLRNAEDGRQSTVDIDQRVKLVTLESDKQILFESREGAGWIHRNYIRK